MTRQHNGHSGGGAHQSRSLRSLFCDFWTFSAYVTGAYLVFLVYHHVNLPSPASDLVRHVSHVDVRQDEYGSGPATDADKGSLHGFNALGRKDVVAKGLQFLDSLAQYGSGGSKLLDWQQQQLLQEQEPEVELTSPNRTLRFQVCNGFANQRLSILYGLLMAKKLGRSAVLPTLVAEGTQRNTDFQVLAGPSNSASFSDFYQPAALARSMARHGLRILQDHEAPGAATYTNVPMYPLGYDVRNALATKYKDTAHLSIDCPIFKLRPDEVPPEDAPFLWAVLDGLRPAAPLQRVVDVMTQNILSVARSPRFNFVHLRLENDWLTHCRKWESIRDNIVRNNCYNNTEAMDVTLKLMAMPPSTPLFVGAHWPDVDPGLWERVRGRLEAANYTVITSAAVLPIKQPLMREAQALVEYYVGFKANKFIGNSVSSFGALLMLERRHRSLWASYYNGGNIPLTTFLPLYRLPWVFTYNSWSPGYDYLLKAAVRSALAHKTLKPYCMFTGSNSSSIYRWLLRHNVTLIMHTLTWEAQLLAKARKHMKENLQHSHLFKSPSMLVGTFQRIDIPVVPVLDQYHYVLYTDSDVFFRRRVTLDDFALPLPPVISMSYEFRPNTYPHNAGIILMHLPQLRRTYHAFVAFILDNQQGLHFGEYGPLDQGALNQFYERELRSQLLPQVFNAKPYNDYDQGAAVVHFHGPKPHEYVAFLNEGKCDFYYVCEQAFVRGLCRYVTEWVKYVEPNSTTVGDKLTFACNMMEQFPIKELWKRKWNLQEAGQGGCPPAAAAGQQQSKQQQGQQQGRQQQQRQAQATGGKQQVAVDPTEKEVEELLAKAGFGDKPSEKSERHRDLDALNRLARGRGKDSAIRVARHQDKDKDKGWGA